MVTMYDKALRTMMHSRFVARAEDLNRPLTDDEVRAEAKYLMETIPYAGMEEAEERMAIKELKRLVRR